MIMTEPVPFPAGGRLAQTAHSLFQPSDRLAPGITFQHLSILPFISRRLVIGRATSEA